MRKTIWYKAKGSTRYANLPKFVFAFLSAHLIITYEEQHSYAEIFSSKFYYYALIINSFIAFTLIVAAYRITLGLDYFFPWSRSYKKRLRWQLFCAVVIVQAISLGFAAIYFQFYGISIFSTVYFSRYFLLISLMLMLLSAYLFYEWSVKNRMKSTPKKVLNHTNDSPEQYWSTSEIACVFIEDKYYFAFNFDAKKIIWRENLTTTISQLPSDQFYQIRSSYIVNRAAIKEVIVVSPRITKILLIEPLNLALEISRRENAAFKKWMTLRHHTLP